MNILLVDDDQTSREAFASMLRMQGYGVDEAVDGYEGFATFETYHTDMIITDCEMPTLDGIELITEIRREGHLIPIIAMSGSIANMRPMMDAGATCFLLKPVNFNDLLACITLQAGKARAKV